LVVSKRNECSYPRNSDLREVEWKQLRLGNYLSLLDLAGQVHPTDLSSETSPTAQGFPPPKVVHSSITETESMEKFRPYLFWMKGRESRHQFQINREN
jgi:hypothetical protein